MHSATCLGERHGAGKHSLTGLPCPQSAKNSMNVDDLFMTVARDAKKRLAEAGALPQGV